MVILRKSPRYVDSRQSFAIFLSLLIHLVIAAFLWLFIRTYDATNEPLKTKKNVRESSSGPVKLKIVEKRNQIIEAPLPPTKEVPDIAAKGRQNRKTERETRLKPRSMTEETRAQDSSRFDNRAGSQNRPDQGNSKAKPEKGGKLSYGDLLPGQMIAYNSSPKPFHNDTVMDGKIPIGEILDINTTDYRFIGYATAVRKQVEQAFYSPLSALKQSDSVAERLQAGETSRFKGESIALLKIERSGLLSEVRIVDSSGDETIDEVWTRILNLAAPFPPLPDDFGPGLLKFHYTLYYDYRINGGQRRRHFQF